MLIAWSCDSDLDALGTVVSGVRKCQMADSERDCKSLAWTYPHIFLTCSFVPSKSGGGAVPSVVLLSSVDWNILFVKISAYQRAESCGCEGYNRKARKEGMAYWVLVLSKNNRHWTQNQKQLARYCRGTHIVEAGSWKLFAGLWVCILHTVVRRTTYEMSEPQKKKRAKQKDMKNNGPVCSEKNI